MGNRRNALTNSDPFASRRPSINIGELTDSMLEPDGQTQVIEKIVEVEKFIEVVPENALVALDNGEMQFGSYTLTSKGLVGGEDADKEQWKLLGKVLHSLEGTIQWLIGDWVLQAEAKWGETYKVVAEQTGYSEKTLREYAHVARKVHLSIRMDKLTFGHHQVVAALPANDQRAWLEWALSQKASISQLRKAVNPPPPSDEWEDEEQQMNVLSQYINQPRAKVAELKPDKRREYADGAERLAEYYARLAEWVRGMG